MSTPSSSVVARALADMGSAAWLMAHAAREAALGRARSGLAEAMAAYVWRPLLPLIVVAVLVGVILGLPVSDLVRMVRAEQVVGMTMSVIVAREIVPIVVGVFAAGRISADLAVRLAGEDRQALSGPGALAPSVLAVLLAAPVHAAAATVATWMTIGLMLQHGALIPWPTYFDLTLGPETYRATWMGAVKTAVFTLVAATAAAAVGSRPAGGPVARVSAAFTAGLVSVLAAVALWSWLD